MDLCYNGCYVKNLPIVLISFEVSYVNQRRKIIFLISMVVILVCFQSKNLLKDGEKIQVLYVKDDDPFPEVTEFMEASR